MENPGTYAVVLVFGVILTLLVGQLLIRAGKAFLDDVFDDRRTAASMSRLLAVLFHLVVLGLLALLSIVDVPTDSTVQTIIAKLGVVLLVLGVAHGATMYTLSQIRNRRRERAAADELSEQVELNRVQQAAQHRDAGQDQQDEPPQPPPVAGGPTIRS